MAHSKRKLKIGDSIGGHAKKEDALSERQRENRQFVIFTLVIPVVLLLIILLLWLFRVWG